MYDIANHIKLLEEERKKRDDLTVRGDNGEELNEQYVDLIERTVQSMERKLEEELRDILGGEFRKHEDSGVLNDIVYHFNERGEQRLWEIHDLWKAFESDLWDIVTRRH